MIRRQGTRPEDGWVLIPQVAHARLAAELAEAWDSRQVPLPLGLDRLRPILRRHDDGWREWDLRLDVAPATGIPLSFTERAAGETHAIWRASIGLVVDLGPLAQWLVADHFLRLRSQGSDRRSPSGRAFLRDFRPRAAAWRAEYQASLPEGAGELPAELQQVLPFFDWLSLWLCLGGSAAPMEVTDWSGRRYVLKELGDGRVDVHPWPFAAQSFEPEVGAYYVPSLPGLGRAVALKRVGRPHVLRWRFQAHP